MDFSVFSSNSLEYILLSLIYLIAVWKDSVVRVIPPYFKSDSQGKEVPRSEGLNHIVGKNAPSLTQ